MSILHWLLLGMAGYLLLLYVIYKFMKQAGSNYNHPQFEENNIINLN